MPFPMTSVLDDFNRADGAIGSAWTGSLYSGEAAPAVDANTAYGDGGWRSAYWNARTFGPDTEVRCVTSGGRLSLALRGTSPGASFSGYEVHVNRTANTVIISSASGGSWTTLGSSISVTFTTGDGVGVEMIGSTINVYRYTGGSWSSIGSRTDSTNTGAGYIGIELDNAARLDDFGGGTLAPPPNDAPAQRRFQHMLIR